ncbi:MAG: hypothetical protein WKF89_05285 [Chitinophagaceae bacterium]
MKQYVEVVVVIPVGPGSNIEFVSDTINSYIFYTGTSYKIIIADDSHQGLGTKLKDAFPDVDIVYTRKAMGGWAGLYITLSLAFKYALTHFDFKTLAKLDTDALVIGPKPEAEALQLFESTPTIGIAGQYPSDYHGKPWDIGWPRKRILNGTTTWKFIRRPYANWLLNKLHKRALLNGYNTGESVFGGAYFMNEKLLVKLDQAGLLPDYKMKSQNLGEDHLFALMAKAEGFDLGNLSDNGMPFACSWKGLPASPEQLFREGRKIIHSTRYWQNMPEQEIRDWFCNKRSETA